MKPYNNKLKRQLDAIDWDFPIALPGSTKLSHWYPGTFPSQLPSTLIQALTEAGDIVFDPYGGAGTTASEAIRLGRKAWVVDVNPIGIMSNYLYIALLILHGNSKDDLKLFFKQVDNMLLGKVDSILGHDFDDINSSTEKLHKLVLQHMRPNPAIILDNARIREQPNWDALSKWLHPVSLKELQDLYIRLESECKNDTLKLIVTSMISSNLRAICSQNKSWGHLADNVYPKIFIYKDVIGQFRKWLKLLNTNINRVNLESYQNPKGIYYWADIHNWKSTKSVKTKPRNSPDIIITSPPYGDAIDYIYAQKLSLYFLGYDDVKIAELSGQEIGARRKRFKTGSRERWADEISTSAIKQSKFMSKGIFVTVLPHKNHGREIGMKMLKNSLKKDGWAQILEIDRSISQKKARQSWTSIKQETINIFLRG